MAGLGLQGLGTRVLGLQGLILGPRYGLAQVFIPLSPTYPVNFDSSEYKKRILNVISLSNFPGHKKQIRLSQISQILCLNLDIGENVERCLKGSEQIPWNGQVTVSVIFPRQPGF